MTQFQPYDLSAHDTVLTDEELNDFFDDLDHERNGFVTLTDLETRLKQVHSELDPDSKDHDSDSDDISECEKGPDLQLEGLHLFLETLFPGLDERIERQQFIDYVKIWNIPSQNQTSSEQEDTEHRAFEARLSWRKAFHVRWIVHGPKTLFVMLVVLLQVGLGIWQGLDYICNYRVRAAMGWGVVIAKFCAGALYPTLFFLILSMSRVFATFMRRYRWISRIVDWDRNQSFHIWMAVTALVLGTGHGIAHLTGSFVAGSEPGRQRAVVKMLGESITPRASVAPRSYLSFLASVPAWTGIAALACFWLMALLSMPAARRRLPYELFQCVHLLMFPIMALLSVHGVTMILGQFPMLGFWIVIPGSLVIYERSVRVLRGFFFRAPAEVQILDEDTALLTCIHPRGKDWRYEVGQYILLQVPAISLFQWHPFTVSACQGKILQVHIKAVGSWTRTLRALPTVGRVGVDGPFGAPSQRFYEFSNSIVIGSGVGITPFSAIVADLVQKANKNVDPWAEYRHSSWSPLPSIASSASSMLSKTKVSASLSHTLTTSSSNSNQKSLYLRPRTVEFHWIVREENHLMWFSSLLNYAYEMFDYNRTPSLQLNINTYVTGRRKNVSTHIFRYLLDAYRTPTFPLSALTGLKIRSRFHRPNMQAILQKFHEDMKKDSVRRERIGVFFCGNPKIGRMLADLCTQLTLQARRDGSFLIYDFVMEVFG